MTTETAYDQVKRLVARFRSLSPAARRAYNEDNTRKDFILPLFHALEWNVYDSAEVSAEEKVSRGWVDFAFRLGGVPRFFLETKRIAENLADPRWIKQAVDYAWTKSVCWALLSDFEGLRVFNAQWQEDNPLRAQFVEFDVDTYLSDFERLWWLSRPEIAAGTLDREAEKVGKKARREPVSQHLFDDLRTWRSELFRHLRAYNPRWSAAQIDTAVLRILNRLIFIRTAEDRQVEGRRLEALLRELRDQRRIQSLVPELHKLFREFDGVYDSQLFEKHLADELECEPQPFERLIEGLYGRRYLLYNFNAIDADVLGAAYEQYLGHVVADPSALLRAGPDAAEIVARRAKRKSQGIYYTPTFVVKYIVAQTLGRYLDEHGYDPSHPVRVLDMACGSGSFLIEAFDVLDRHVAHMRGQLTSSSLLVEEGQGVRSDIHERARQTELLGQCIYGVDKDEQAVAVARLNLLLKALHSRDRLPMLDHIRCGDSLISGPPDELRAAFGPDWQAKKPFNWHDEFPEVFAPSPQGGEGWGEGGFDVIVGNPPYVRPHNLPVDLKAYLWGHFPVFVAKSDFYCCFIQQAIDLAKPGGLIGFIVSDSWLRLDSFQAVRDYVLSTCRIVELVNLPGKVFEDATVRTVVFILQKEQLAEKRPSNQVRVLDLPMNATAAALLHEIPQHVFENTHRHVFDLSLSAEVQSFKQRMEAGNPKLAELVDIRFGLKTGDDATFIQKSARTDQHRPLLRGENVHRYRTEFSGEYVWYVPDKMREHRKTARPGEKERFEQAKILVRDTGQWLECTLDLENYYVKDVLILTGKLDSPCSLHYIAGVLNSRAVRFYYETSFPTLHVQASELEVLPIRRIDFSDPADKARHDRLVALVDDMLDLHRRHAAAVQAMDDARRDLARRIAAVDTAIDRLVYELYGLAEDEIAIVEISTT